MCQLIFVQNIQKLLLDNCKNRIIDLFDFESITNIAKKNMEQTISIYNEVYGF